MRLIQTGSTRIILGIAATCLTLVGLPSAHAGFVAAPLHFNIEVSDGGGVVYSDSYEADTKFELGGAQFAYDILSIDHAAFTLTPSSFTIASGQPSGALPAGIFTGFNF